MEKVIISTGVGKVSLAYGHVFPVRDLISLFTFVRTRRGLPIVRLDLLVQYFCDLFGFRSTWLTTYLSESIGFALSRSLCVLEYYPVGLNRQVMPLFLFRVFG